MEDSDKSPSVDKIVVESEKSSKNMDGEKLKSDLALRGKDLSDLLELKRSDPRMMELREIKANRASFEHMESSSSVNGKVKSKNLKSNPLLQHKFQDKQLSVSQQTLTNVSVTVTQSILAHQ